MVGRERVLSNWLEIGGQWKIPGTKVVKDAHHQPVLRLKILLEWVYLEICFARSACVNSPVGKRDSTLPVVSWSIERANAVEAGAWVRGSSYTEASQDSLERLRGRLGQPLTYEGITSFSLKSQRGQWPTYHPGYRSEKWYLLPYLLLNMLLTKWYTPNTLLPTLSLSLTPLCTQKNSIKMWHIQCL